MTSVPFTPTSDAEIKVLAAAVRRMYEERATPTQLLLFISEQLGRACCELEFPMIKIMRGAFGFSLKGATDAFLSPRMNYKVLRTDEEFDAMFSGAIEANRDSWPDLTESPQ